MKIRVSKPQTRMERECMCNEVLQFFFTAQGCPYSVNNVLLVKLRIEPSLGRQDAVFHESYTEACIVRAHSTTSGYPHQLGGNMGCC